MRYPAVVLSMFSLAVGLADTGLAQPSNDTVATARVIPADVSFVRIRDNLARANDDLLTYVYQGRTFEDLFQATVWFSFTPPMSGTVNVSVVGGGFPAFSETFRGTGPNDLELIAFDDRGNFAGGVNTYSYEAVGGRTYFSNLGDPFRRGGNGVGSTYVYLQTFVPGAFADSFAGRIALFGQKFAVTGSNAGFSAEEGEPQHSTTSLLPSRSTAWFSYTRDTRTSVSIEVTAGFEPLLSVYTGTTVADLQRVAQGSRSGTSPITRLTFVAEADTSYAIAVDGNRGGEGTFTMRVESSNTRPGFLVRPVSTTAYQGDPAFFNVVAASTGVPTFQWQRQAAGSRTWVNISEEDLDYSGATSDSLVVNAAMLEMHLDKFRLLVTDDVGTTTSPIVTLTVTEFPVIETEVRGSVLLDISEGSLPTGAEGEIVTYFANGLPKGVTIDKDTGVISGEVTGVPRSYPVTYGVIIDGKRSPVTRALLINVAPFPAAFSGGFEALLVAGTPVLPMAKLSIQVTGAGALSGNLFTLADARSYGFRGSLSLDETMRTSEADIIINRGRQASPYALKIQLDEATGKLTATLNDTETTTELGATTEGVQLSAFSSRNPAPWAANYTSRLVDAIDLATPPAVSLPGGNGFATSRIAAAGNLSVSGRLFDGTKFTANLRSSTQAEYRFGQRLFAGVGGSLSGWVRLLGRDFEGAQYYVPPGTGSDLYLVKPANVRDRFYPAGFGPVGVTWLMDPWLNPGPGLLATSLLLNDEGDFKLNIQIGDITNPEGNERGLPLDAKLNARGQVVVAAPNPSSFRVSLNAGTGSYTGSFVIFDTDPVTERSIRRTVTFFGVLIQSPETFEGSVIGQGFAILPPINARADTSITGKVEFLAGPPSLPFFVDADAP